MTFYQRFEGLCNARNLTPTKVARENGITQQSVSLWKKRGSTPKAETLQKLAAYFGVSINFLLGNERERVIIPGRLSIVEVDDPDSGFWRYDIKAEDEDAFLIGVQILENGLEKSGLSVPSQTPQALILAALNRLNYDGQQKAVERVMELVEIPRYRCQDAPQPPPPAPPEDTDPTPAAPPPESPQDGE